MQALTGRRAELVENLAAVTRVLLGLPTTTGTAQYPFPSNLEAITGTIEGAETSGSYPDPGFEAYSREAVGR